MFKYLICMKSIEGVQLFSRSFPSSKQLPFALIATLNGIYTYGDNYGVKIVNADSDEFKVTWKTYNSNITLILIENETIRDDSQFILKKLDLIFKSMVLLFGIDDLINIKNIEKFKKEIRISYPLIDNIINNNKYELYGDITNCVDIFLTSEKSILQNALDTITEVVNTHYSCLIMNGRIIVASKPLWENFKRSELYLINLLCMTATSATCRDIPICLPHESSHTISRLLTYSLTSNDFLCFICTQNPTIDSIETEIRRIWHPVYKQLINHKLNISKHFTNNVNIDANIIAFLLINKKTKCVVSSLSPHGVTNNDENGIKSKFDCLKHFYQIVVVNYFDLNYEESDLNEEAIMNDCIVGNQAYTLIDNYQCYAINSTLYEFYALFNRSIPTYAIRGVANESLSILVKDDLI